MLKRTGNDDANSGGIDKIGKITVAWKKKQSQNSNSTMRPPVLVKFAPELITIVLDPENFCWNWDISSAST
jgi:hypothetical protein